MLLGPENWTRVDLLSFTNYINGYFRIIVAFNSHTRVEAWACVSVFRTSDSKVPLRVGHCVSHYPTNCWAFLFSFWRNRSLKCRRGSSLFLSTLLQYSCNNITSRFIFLLQDQCWTNLRRPYHLLVVIQLMMAEYTSTPAIVALYER